MLSQSCETCQSPSTQSCSACGNVFYCTKEHQKMDWKAHKKNCSPFKVLINDTLGRHLVATRNIKAGEVIMKKNPLILGPKMISPPLCLGCHKRLATGNSNHLCTQCKWPLCREGCEKSKLHQDECKIFTKYKYCPEINLENSKQSVYALILPLRALILKQNQKDKFDIIQNLQSHLKEHIDTPIYRALKRSLVPLLMAKLKIDTNEEEILNLCSIFDTNAFEVRDTKGMINIRALYSMVSYISHDCKQNTKHVFNRANHEIAFITTIHIEKNSLVTATYTQTLWGTLSRRSHLKEAKHFECVCDRCKDVSEFETYAGSFYCSECNDNKSKMLSTDPLDQNAPWHCENCENEMEGSEVIHMNNFYKQNMMDMDKSDPKYLEQFLEAYQHVLHPTNYHLLQIKYALFQMYSGIEFSNEIINRKIKICRELLEIANTLEPGYSRFRGCILYELHLGLLERNERDRKSKKIGDSDYQKCLEEAEAMFKKSKKILKPEPDYEDLISSRLTRDILMNK